MTVSNTMHCPEKPFRVCILAGEASGDLHAAELIEPLKARYPEAEFFGLGGDKMAALGTELLFHVRDLAIIGFLEVVKHLPFILRVRKTLKAEIIRRQPDLVVFVDYPGFNLRFAKTVKQMGFPTLYYISPQVWAWGKKRIKQMAQRIDRLLVILPFEKPVYQKSGLDVHFVGNPLKDVVKTTRDRSRYFSDEQLDADKPLLAILPGSRPQEVKGLLPEMADAARRLKMDFPDLQVRVGAAATLDDSAYAPFLDDTMPIRREKTYDLMAHADLALVASGTATLETAILGTPMIICYQIAPLTYFLGKMLVKIEHIGLVNIVAGRTVVPELIQHEANGERMAQEARAILSDENRYQSICEGLAEASAKLGEPGAAERAAHAVIDLLEQRQSR